MTEAVVAQVPGLVASTPATPAELLQQEIDQVVDWIDLSDVESFCVVNPDKVFPEFDFDQPAELQHHRPSTGSTSNRTT